MPARLLVCLLSVSLAALSASCGPGVDLSTALAVTDIHSGYFDNGFKDGQHHLLPSVSFRLRNQSEADLTSIQLTVQFWKDGADGELDSRPLTGVSTDPLLPGAETEPFVVRSSAGYLLPDSDISALFQNSQFTDVTVRMFVRRSGHIVKIGEYKVERRILTQVRDPGRP
jgi:hypothetical protein